MATAVVEAPTEQMSPSVKQALTTAEKAKSLVVHTIVERGQAGELGRAIVQLDKEVEAFFKPMKDSAFETHRKICAKEKEVRGPLDEAKRHLSRQIGDYDARMEAERRQEEARLQEEARVQAIADAKKLADEQALNDAIALEAEGDTQAAEAVLNNPVPIVPEVVPVVLERMVPKTAGVSTQQNWTFRITDEAQIPREYLMVDEKKIRQIVRALKGTTNIPGVQAYPENGARFRA